MSMMKSRSKVLLALSVVLLAPGLAASAEPNLPIPWWDPNRAFCVPLSADAGPWERTDAPAEVFVNFTGVLAQAGHAGAVVPDSLRLFEVGPDGAMIAVSGQYDPFTTDSGTLVFLLDDVTPAGLRRQYRLYFGVAGVFEPEQVALLIEVTDDVPDEGMAAYRIATPAATYFYQKEAGGFSSLLDIDGNDWINFHPWGGSDGIYRGIPNLVHPDNIFHPGHANCTSSLRHTGPLKATIHTVSKNGRWECLWEIYPAHARLTILRAPDQSYWFLYEGTPGGSLDLTTDYCVRSNGLRTDMNQSWTGDIAGSEWLYFEDSRLDRYLYFIHEEDDDHVDSFYQMETNMTVFGFGRTGLNKYLMGGPRHFTIGLADNAEFAAARSIVEASYHPVDVSVGPLLSLAEPTFGGGTADTTLAGSWSFDEGAGDIAYDSSRFANHSVLVGATWTPEGRSAGAIEFDGKDDNVTIKGYKGVVGMQPRTVTAWVRTEADDYADLISWGGSGPGQRWLLLLTRGSRSQADGALQVVVGTGFVTGTTRITGGQWHHVAVVLEAADNPTTQDIRLYVDGTADAISGSAESPVNTAAGPEVTLGVRQIGERYFFDGAMDEVRIYSRALTSAEIQELASPDPQ